MSNLITIARPYAKAIFDLALEQSSKDQDAFVKWDNNLNYLSQLIENETIQKFLHGFNSDNNLASQIIALCGEDIDIYAQNLIRLMAENKRLLVIPEVYKEYKAYIEAHFGIANVDIISAFSLNEEQQQKIASAMEHKLACKVNLNCRVDQSLIAGVIIRTKDLVIDGSTRGQLKRLADNLQC